MRAAAPFGQAGQCITKFGQQFVSIIPIPWNTPPRELDVVGVYTVDTPPRSISLEILPIAPRLQHVPGAALGHFRQRRAQARAALIRRGGRWPPAHPAPSAQAGARGHITTPGPRQTWLVADWARSRLMHCNKPRAGMQLLVQPLRRRGRRAIAPNGSVRITQPRA